MVATCPGYSHLVGGGKLSHIDGGAPRASRTGVFALKCDGGVALKHISTKNFDPIFFNQMTTYLYEFTSKNPFQKPFDETAKVARVRTENFQAAPLDQDRLLRSAPRTSVFFIKV